MLLIRLTFKILGYFESHATHQGIAFGTCVGMMLALTPPDTLQFGLICSLLFLLQLNLTAVLVAGFLFSIPAYLGKLAFSQLGEYLLTRNSLTQVWTFLYECPLLPFSNFYIPETLGKWVNKSFQIRLKY